MKKEDGLLEILFNSISHGLGAIYAIVLAVVLIMNSDNGLELVSSILFSFSVFYMLLMSTLYHSLVKTKARAVFKRLDHSAIYFLIASSFIPFLLLAVENAPNYLGAIFIFGVAIFGMVLKAINPYKYSALHITVFLAMGWSGLFLVGDISSFNENAFLYLCVGGVSYTLGVIFYAIKFKLSHFIWHIFVLGGVIAHSVAIYFVITN